METDRIVTYRLLGEERQAVVRNAATDDEAKAAVTSDIAKSLNFVGITPVRPRKRRSLFSTYMEGFFFKVKKLVPAQ